MLSWIFKYFEHELSTYISAIKLATTFLWMVNIGRYGHFCQIYIDPAGESTDLLLERYHANERLFFKKSHS